MVGNRSTSSEIILQERAAHLPTVWAKPGREPMLTRAGTAEDYIGRGYKIGNTILGDSDNASSSQIIDVERIKASIDRNLIDAVPVRKSDIQSVAYNDWNRYAEKHNFTEKIKTGFNLNIGIFTFGREKTVTEKFSTSNIAENRSVYGEISIEIRYGRHFMNTSPATLKLIASKYLNNVFLSNLYNQSIGQTREYFGDFVITNYYSGGRATALYQGNYEGNESVESRERDMQEKIDASFKYEPDPSESGAGPSASGSASLEFGRNNYDEISDQNQIGTVYSYIRTTGGIPSSGANNNLAKSVDQNEFNLNGWLASLSSTDTHTLIGFEEQGLYPISDFILEENFAIRLQDSHAGYLPENQVLQEPFIEIVKLYVRKVGTEKLYDVVPVLNTRQGDKLIIAATPSSQKTDAELRSYNNPATFLAKANEIKAIKAQYYQCLIKANPNVILNPLLRNPLVFDLTGINEANMYKLFNPETNMYYLFDINKRVALSYHSDPFILYIYGLLEWSEDLQNHSAVTINSIANSYRVYGL